MTSPTRESLLFDAFATLADTLVAEYDVVELLQLLVETCQSALGVAEAGLLLANPHEELELVASTSESMELVEAIQLAAEQGPCIDSFRTGRTVSVPDIAADSTQGWEQFREVVAAQGFRAVYTVPLRLRDEVLGTLNLFGRDPGPFTEHDTRAAQALADVATIGILHERSFRASDLLREQLQVALDSRVVIEQAKGILAHTHSVSPEQAFDLLRKHARDSQQRLAEVAGQIVRREIIV
jgi:GAF domain-containing protein